MKFDFDHAKHLAESDPEAFETYRVKVLFDYLQTFSPEKLRRLSALQDEIDQARDRLEPFEYLLWISNEMSAKLDELSNKMIDLHNKVNDRELIRAYVSKRRDEDVI